MSEASMSAEAKKKEAEYYREWRKRNPGKAAEYQRRYWRRKAEQNKKEASDGALTAKSSE